MKRTHVIAIAAATLGLLVTLAWLVAGDPVSQSKWDKIREGMTQDQVIEIMGKPDSYDGNQIQYSGSLNVGWVEFAFNEKKQLIWKNDESVFGSLK